MKLVLSSLFIVILFLMGCESNTDLSTNLSTNGIESLPPPLISLPGKSAAYQDSVFSVSATINGSAGGTLILDKYYISNTGGTVTIYARLDIPANAFSGTQVITMTVDQYYAALQFTPALTFSQTLLLDQEFEGINLTGIPVGNIDFAFVRLNNTIERLEKETKTVIPLGGILSVENAQLRHFSRYGWVR